MTTMDVLPNVISNLESDLENETEANNCAVIICDKVIECNKDDFDANGESPTDQEFSASLTEMRKVKREFENLREKYRKRKHERDVAEKKNKELNKKISNLEQHVEDYKSESRQLKSELQEEYDRSYEKEKELFDFNEKNDLYLNQRIQHWKKELYNYENTAENQKTIMLKEIKDARRIIEGYKEGQECLVKELIDTNMKLRNLKDISSISQLSSIGLKRKKKIKWHNDDKLVQSKTYIIEEGCKLERWSNQNDNSNDDDDHGDEGDSNNGNNNNNNNINDDKCDTCEGDDDDDIENKANTIPNTSIISENILEQTTETITKTSTGQINIDIDFDELSDILFLVPSTINGSKCVV